MSRIALLLLLSLGAFVCEAKLRASSVRLGSSPGVALRLRKSAIDSLFKNVAQLASRYAHKLPIPDVTATVSGVDISTKNVKITNFPPPAIHYKLVAPNQIIGSFRLPAVGIEGPFNATRHVFVTNQHDSGLIVFNASNAEVKFQAKLGEFDNGVPNVADFQCESSLGPANLHVKGAKEKFATEVLALAAKAFRPAYNSQVCAVTKKMITTQLNRLLSKIPNVIDVNSKVSVKFQLKPVVADDYIELRAFGKVITDLVSPHVPAAFEEAHNKNAHVVLFVSDAIVNDLAFQAYANNLLTFAVNHNSQPILYDLVKLNCDADEHACLGNVAPNLAEKYGADGAVEANFKATKAPEVEFSAGKATFTAAWAADLFITSKNDSQRYHEATASVDVTGDFQVKIKDAVAYGRVSVENVVVHIDQEHNKKWEDKIKGTVKKIVEQYINGDFLLKGLPLRLPFGVGLEEPLVTFLTHTLQVQTGFVYKAEVSAEKK